MKITKLLVKYKDSSGNLYVGINIFNGDDFSFIYLPPKDKYEYPCIALAVKDGDVFVDYFKNKNSWTNTSFEELETLKNNLILLFKTNQKFNQKEYETYLKLKEKYE